MSVDHVPADEKVIDYLNKPPQRYDIGLEGDICGAVLDVKEHPTGEWVRFEDMDLYMFEGGQLMQQCLAELKRLREIEWMYKELCK
jgi:hypothetical protein